MISSLVGLSVVLFLVSCTQKQAPIFYKKTSFGSLSYKNKKSHFDNKTSSNQELSRIVVARGENIYSISKKYNIPIRDLISKNNLVPPYFLKVGDKINLPSNQYYQVIDGDTLYSISRKYGMNINNLITINNLSKPYFIMAGQRLKINNTVDDKNADERDSGKAFVLSGKNNSTQSFEKRSEEVVPDYKLEKKSEKVSAKNNSDKIIEPKIPSKNNHFIFPVKGVVISKFGPKAGGLYNDGINIKAKSGENVRATEDGAVAYVGSELRGYGNLIIIKHSGGWISAYGHLDKTKVKRGSKVKKNESIATVGSTGNVHSPQLYFGLRKGREALNPENYIRKTAPEKS